MSKVSDVFTPRVRLALGALASLALFVVALAVLHRLLGQFRLSDIASGFRELPPHRIALAALLALASYGLLTVYDWLGLRHVGQHLPYHRSALTAFSAYAVGHNIGLAALSGGAVRFRLYGAAGLSAADITGVIAFGTLTFALGSTTLLGLSLLLEGHRAAALLRVPDALAGTAGALLLAAVVAYVTTTFVRRAPLSVRGWTLRLPSPRITVAQLIVSVADAAIASAVLYVLLPSEHGLTYVAFVGLYLVAVAAALISNVPGGLGVFESVVMLLVPGASPHALFGALLAYRLVYYAVPFCLAIGVLAVHEAWLHRAHLGRAALLARSWLSAVTPQAMAVAAFLAGFVLLMSGVTPGAEDRLRILERALPLPVLEVSHLVGSAAGIGLVILARGLSRRLDAAWHLALWLLGAGILASLLKGIDWEEALLLGAMLAALALSRDRFHRRASLLDQPFTSGWALSISLALVAALWLGLFSYRHVEYASELWWQFEFDGNAPRMLRASLLAVLLAASFALIKLLRPAPPDLSLPLAGDLDRAARLVDRSTDSSANLALLGDKKLLFADGDEGFLMFRESGRSWVAMGDPVGTPAVREALAWRFREFCDRHDAWPVFYQVSPDSLPVYVDLGLALSKLGEEARVPLGEFSLEGSQRADLRQSWRRGTRDGLTLEIVEPVAVTALLPRLRAISDAWLATRAVAEKGFSVGHFDDHYLARFPCALVRCEGHPVAFSNVWTSGGREELSVDLMRYSRDAPKSAMDFLFVELMLWGRANGYRWFNLGMAPLAGLEPHALAPAWHRMGAFIYRHGEHFYNFEGLRHYKEKFAPVWRPRYLASPGGLALARVALDVTTLIAGGIREIVTK